MDFFEAHPVFRHDEFIASRRALDGSRHTSNNVLAMHLAAGRLLRVRRGLYAVVPRGLDPKRAPVDPYLVASHLTGDGVVAYHAALQFHGKSYSISRRYHFLTDRRSRPFRFRDLDFVPVLDTALAGTSNRERSGIAEHAHAGGRVRVTTLERTLVDALDAPDRCGGWEETWRSLELVEYFDLDAVIRHALAKGSALTIAKIGFFLEQHRDALMVEDAHLRRLRCRAPAQPRYVDVRRTPGKLVVGWNLVVPPALLKRDREDLG